MSTKENNKNYSSAKQGSVLVIGAGISGIQSSLDLADAGFKVFLVDRGLSVGGTMTQLDKTFPTNDCSMCILAPKLVYTGRHRNIEIITNSKIIGIKGEVGNFEVRVRKYPRFVDLDICNGCGDCVEHCPVNILSDYDEGLGFRKAIYQPFPQAIPNVFAIDKENKKAPCKIHCPAGLNAQGFIALASQEKFAEAYTLIREKIPLPGSLGRICYHICETQCNRKEIDEPVSISRIRRFIADYIYEHPEKLENYTKIREQNLLKIENREEVKPRGNSRKVAIIGAGPSGLTTAYDLGRIGYSITLFEAEKKNGGMLYYGIPGYRLPKDYLSLEIKSVLEEGKIEIHNGQRFGKDFTIEDLKKKGFEAVFVAIGAWKSKKFELEGTSDKVVIQGIDFLHSLNNDKIEQDYFKRKKVLVIGGGNVAMDCARSSSRLGGDVTIVYRRTIKEMPAHIDEIKDAQEEAINFNLLTLPLKLSTLSSKTHLTCQKMKLGEPDESGRRKPIPIEGSDFDIPCDAVIFAIGQELDLSSLKGSGVDINGNNLIKVDSLTLQTSRKDVFAGGDAVTGPASAVEAIGTGHKAALSIDRYLNEEDLKKGREVLEEEPVGIPESASKTPIERNEGVKIAIKKRINTFEEVEGTYAINDAINEAKRCLNCGGCCECMQCVEHCQKGAIDHTMTEDTQTIIVGAVIVSPGFAKYSPPIGDSFGYGLYPNVLTSIEFERMLSASGPYKGHIERISDNNQPKKVAWLQCVGSRDESCNHTYCSSVCCMYAIKEAVIAQEHQPGLEAHIYFMDVRSFGKDFERYYERAKDEYGIVFRRSRIPRIEQDRETKNLKVRYIDDAGNVQSDIYDMIILSVGLLPCNALGDISTTLQINLNEYGFVETDPFFRVETSRAGIYASGTVTEPKDIPESITQASAAAAEAAKDISDARGTQVTEKKYPAELDVKNEFPRIGVFVCHCGINIGGVIDVKKVVEYSSTLPYVAYADDSIFTCSQDSQEKIKEKIKEFGLNRVIIASCTPRTHEPLFQDTLMEAGLNPHLFEMVNIRDQNSWVHRDYPERATKKAIDLVKMGVAKAAELKPVLHHTVPVNKSALVIGGGIAGMNSALSIADQGFNVHLIEKENELGGNIREIFLGIGEENPQVLLKDTIQKVMHHPMIDVHTATMLEDISGYVGNFQSSLKNSEKSETIRHGVVVVATGAEPYEPTEFEYGKSPNIIKQRELEKNIAECRKYISELKEVVMIQCVGSRNDKHPYCSRVCCSNAVNNALKLKKTNPGVSVYILYRDIRTYGFREDKLYREARKLGVLFIRYEKEQEPEVTIENGEISVRVLERVLGEEIIFHPDKLVLSTGIVPIDNTALSQQLKVPLNAENFYVEAHMKLRPVDFSADGIFLCGLAHSPRFVEESILQAKAAGARAATILSKEYLETKGEVAHITSRNCAGCQLCIKVCPYEAIEFDEDRKVVVVNEILCQGCGACSAICPSGTSQQNSFTKKQVISMIDACLT